MSTRPLILINNTLRVEIATRGAELQSVRSLVDDTEYLWNGDATYWNRRAPHLFPIVGKIRDNTYTHHGASFTLPQHGFARDSIFELHASDDTSAHYILSADDATRAHYPFEFDLYIHYKLLDATVHTTYELVHTFGEPLPFALGTHPAFLIGEGAQQPTITSSEPLPDMSSQLKDGLLTHAPAAYAHTAETIELTADTFVHDALIFKKYTPASWKLTRADGKTVEITQDGFTHSALWSKPQAPFVCIEHWSGHADTPDAPTELSEKPTLTHLKDGHMQYTTAMRFM